MVFSSSDDSGANSWSGWIQLRIDENGWFKQNTVKCISLLLYMFEWLKQLDISTHFYV